MKDSQSLDYLGIRKRRFPTFHHVVERIVQVENGSSGNFVILRTDAKGTIIYWANVADSSLDYIDFTDVLDVRYGKYAKPPQKVIPKRLSLNNKGAMTKTRQKTH